MTSITANAPSASRTTATNFLAAVRDGTSKTEAAQKAFFNALLSSAVPAADLAAYKAALSKLNALKAGEQPEGGYDALSKIISQYVQLKEKCLQALKPFINEIRTSPDTFDEINALSSEGVKKASGKGVDNVIKSSGLSKAEIADAFSAPIDFDKFIAAQFKSDKSLDVDVAENLRRQFYGDSDPRS